ncbi:type I toxin-antitoxin system SymE family toxin [Pectobacterium brasiliense]|uniref:SymE family type I addiction module toxin n=1 Tax=Pectobacterium brasiliense TaxID=180957 RepID=UPI001CE1B2E3|nr:SymE family type I addiction module toxin [Pectobacterium brasiliense]MCA5920795.1 type I toxin-antitoxin system SymE family toxin [Pectobacterium brasiliense]MCA5927235.1 type I toxin-antitoxin system SymE family toxin [Pectobacterium brasiliense]MCA5936826.1 type I toxin-antitoxin system SymE family toxin [Pectobacterium brasiliense]MCA5940725.1 type I toxin-antitoxin system SymE family toxin [Pectobacterium brasiliense]MCA5944307.1 type I toxin-antitoxin system SymE family toxin [Pectoba
MGVLVFAPRYSVIFDKLHPPSATNLKGRWLEESGFMTEIAIMVMVERGKIVIETKINLRRRI